MVGSPCRPSPLFLILSTLCFHVALPLTAYILSVLRIIPPLESSFLDCELYLQNFYANTSKKLKNNHFFRLCKLLAVSVLQTRF